MFLFEAPPPPVSMVMPETPQLVFTTLWGVVCLALLGYAGNRSARRRDPLLGALLIGGAICYFAEPMVDVLGLLWHPTIGQWVAIDMFRAAPWWGVFVYAICFGGLPYFTLADFRRNGLTQRRIGEVQLVRTVGRGTPGAAAQRGQPAAQRDGPMRRSATVRCSGPHSPRGSPQRPGLLCER